MPKIIIPLADKSMVEHICVMTTQVCKLPKNSLRHKTREQIVHIPRMVASNIARVKKGIHYNCIASELNRDRSSVYHYEKQHDVLYKTWALYRNTFNKVFAAVENNMSNNLKTMVATIHTNSNNISSIEKNIRLLLKNSKHNLDLDLL